MWKPSLPLSPKYNASETVEQVFIIKMVLHHYFKGDWIKYGLKWEESGDKNWKTSFKKSSVRWPNLRQGSVRCRTFQKPRFGRPNRTFGASLVKTIKTKYKEKKHWIDHEIRESSKRKRELHVSTKKDSTNEDLKSQYKAHGKSHRKLVKRKKVLHEIGEYDKCKNNPKMIWKMNLFLWFLMSLYRIILISGILKVLIGLPLFRIS